MRKNREIHGSDQKRKAGRRIRRFLFCTGILICTGAVPAAGKTPDRPVIQKMLSPKKGMVKIRWKADPDADDFQIRMINLKTGSYTAHSIYDSEGHVETTISGSAIKPGEKVAFRIRTEHKNGNRVRYSKWSPKIRIIVSKKESSKKTNSGNKKQKIRVRNHKNVYSGKIGKKIPIKAEAKGKLSYSINRPDIGKVAENGEVTVIGYGRVLITIKAKRTQTYRSVSKKIKWTFLPAKGKIRGRSPGKGKLHLDWKQDRKADGYEIQYSDRPSFSGGGTRRGYTQSNDVIHTSVSGLKSKTRYCVRVRSYINWNGKRITGPWSTARVRIR